MNSAAIIILAITAAIALPFIIINLNKKRKYAKFDKDFLNLVQKEKLELSQKEIWNHQYAIGIDNNSKKLIYAKKQKDGITDALIDLKEVATCRVVSTNKSIKNQNGRSALTDRLELVFSFNNSKSEKILEFYESSDFMPNEDERSHVEKWMQVINSSLSGSGK